MRSAVRAIHVSVALLVVTAGIPLAAWTPATAQPLSPSSFSPKTDLHAGKPRTGVALADLNGDGKPDLAVANAAEGSVSVFINTTTAGAGTPRFGAAVNVTVGSEPIDLVLGDLDGDDRPDLVVANHGSNSVTAVKNVTPSGGATATFGTPVSVNVGARPAAVALGQEPGGAVTFVAVANSGDGTVSLLANRSAGAISLVNTGALSTGGTPSSVAAEDLNGDGKPDLAVTNEGPNTVGVFMNIGAGDPTFGTREDFATGSDPARIAIGDINRDGKPDLAVANHGGGNTVSVLLNQTATGSSNPDFSPPVGLVATDEPLGVVLGDLNGDGALDIVVTNNGAATVSVFHNATAPGAGTPSFATKVELTTGASPWSVALADLNDDDKLDLITGNTTGANVSVLLNTTAAGSPSPALAAADPGPKFATRADFRALQNPRDMAIGDLNGDGRPDIVVATHNHLQVLINAANPGASEAIFETRAQIPTAQDPWKLAVADFNGDGKPDLAVANFGGPMVSVFLNTTPTGGPIPTVSAPVEIENLPDPQEMVVADFNGDGRPDLAVVSYATSQIGVQLNATVAGASQPTFESVRTFETRVPTGEFAVGDVNRDGKPDLVVPMDDHVRIFQNGALFPHEVDARFQPRDGVVFPIGVVGVELTKP
ncbi:MAG: FG-GAP repeat domain-containing protein, partial [Chloroflexota bacterium]